MKMLSMPCAPNEASTIAVSKARRRDVHHERRGHLHGQVADHRVGRKVDARFRLQLEDDGIYNNSETLYASKL
jgi:hypothetical protein